MEQVLEDERRRFDDLQRNYQNIVCDQVLNYWKLFFFFKKSSAGNQVEQMEREIQVIK